MTDEIYRNDYMRRLLIEAPYIRAKLENPGGSVIQTGVTADTEALNEYSSQIGSSFHLDLIETELHLSDLPTDQQQALLAWAAGVSAKQAALYYSAKGTVLRKRRERGVDTLTEKMNDGRTHNGRGSRPDTQSIRETEGRVNEETGDSRRAQTTNHQGEGDNPVIPREQKGS